MENVGEMNTEIDDSTWGVFLSFILKYELGFVLI